MPSSISSSDISTSDTAAPEIFRPDWSPQEQPQTVSTRQSLSFERRIPPLPWTQILFFVASITLVLMVAWEIKMRHLGLKAGDLDDGRGYWAAERRKVDAVPRDSIVIIGDSRILMDTDLATWQRLTGRRPIQLAILGADAQPVLHDLAADGHFAGLLVIGTAEFSYFDGAPVSAILKYANTESPSQRIGQQIYKTLSRYLAFLDSDYTLFKLLEAQPWPERKGVEDPYQDVWKISESYDDRQTYLWERIERDEYLRRHTQDMWKIFFAGPMPTATKVQQVSATTRDDIDRIRARGGEVVWVRPPSSGPALDIERARYPRREVWDKLVHNTASFGVYFEDYPEMHNLSLPDWSHLTKSSAIAFTDAYVCVLRDRVEWLKTHETPDGRGSRMSDNRP